MYVCTYKYKCINKYVFTCLCLYIFNIYTNPDNFKVVFENFHKKKKLNEANIRTFFCNQSKFQAPSLWHSFSN